MVDPAHRHPQTSGHGRDEPALDDHREEHDDEDDPVDRTPVPNAADQRERCEQNRDSALEPAPHHEQALASIQADGGEERADHERPDHETEEDREHESVEPDVVLDDRAEIDGEAERGEDDDLRQAGEGAEEALDLALARRRGVSDQDPGDEDRQEAGAVDRRRDTIEHACGGEHTEGVERRLGERDPSHQWQQRRRSSDPDRGAADHLDRELPDHDPEAAAVRRRELDHPDHQRDPGRVVRARLALEDRAGAAADLPAGEDGERDRGIGRRERGAEQSARDPAEVE